MAHVSLMKERSLRSVASTTYAAWPCLALHSTGTRWLTATSMYLSSEPDHVPGLAFFAMGIELSKLLGLRVDLNIPGFLSPHFRD